MNLPKPKYKKSSSEQYFIPLIIYGYNYTAVVVYLSGYPSSMEEPGEPSSIEINRVYDSYGVDITNEISEKDFEELDEWFNNPPKKPSISFRNNNI